MRFCQRHWDDLRARAIAAGLPIASNGEEAAAMLESGAPDGLMGAHNRIVNVAIGIIGLPLLLSNDCPVCACSALCPCGKPDCCDWYPEQAVKDELEFRQENPPS